MILERYEVDVSALQCAYRQLCLNLIAKTQVLKSSNVLRAKVQGCRVTGAIELENYLRKSADINAQI